VTKPSRTKYEEIKMKPIDHRTDPDAATEGGALKTLAEHIAAHLGRRPFCVVFEDELERCWPSNPMAQAERNSEIHRFAESQGWTATILEGVFGTRAIFQKLEPDAVDYESSPGVE
jgi:hypothetical protein